MSSRQCSCRDCMDISSTAAKGGWTLCWECLAAGCTPYPPGRGEWPGRRPAGDYECQRTDAYGGQGESTREYRVVFEGGDIDVFDNAEDMRAAANRARTQCRELNCGTDGQEVTPGRGDFACGVMNPHGISIQVCEGEEDVTQDYLING